MRNILYFNILILFFYSCASNESANKNTGGGQANSYDELLYIECTVDGTDRETQEVSDSMQLWSHYHGNVYSAKVTHGEKVLAIKRQGDAIFVETRNGNRGWLSYWNLKELKKHYSNQ